MSYLYRPEDVTSRRGELMERSLHPRHHRGRRQGDVQEEGPRQQRQAGVPRGGQDPDEQVQPDQDHHVHAVLPRPQHGRLLHLHQGWIHQSNLFDYDSEWGGILSNLLLNFKDKIVKI